MEKTCFMFGHRRIHGEIGPLLIRAIEDEYIRGTREFVIGNRGAFDRMAARVVRDMKRVYGDISSTLLLAYHPGERPVNDYDMEYFDRSFYPLLENVPRRLAIVAANQYMLKNCDSVICYVNHIGNTRELLEKAERLKLPITNVWQ